VNDSGRTAVASDFTMTIGGVVAVGGNSFPGSEAGTDKVVTTGSYSVSESGPAGYLSTFSSGCSGTISAGQTVTCTVTNDDTPAPLDLVTLCFHNRTIVVQQKFVAALLAQGARLGPC
jgi:large repetitive protein